MIYTESSGRREKSLSAFSLSIFFFLFLLLTAIVVSSVIGVKGVTLSNLSQAIAFRSDDVMSYTIWHIRVPRALLGAVLGAALAMAGCLMQAVTRNHLADPEVMGINQGASMLVVITLMVFGSQDMTWVVLIAAFAGSALGGGVIYRLAFTGEYTPTRLVLSGLAISFFFGSITTGFIVLFENDLMEILYWMAGKLSGASWLDLRIALFSIIPVMVICILLSNQFNILLLGEEMARGLGQNVEQTRRIAAMLIIVLVGTAVALAGPIGYVGLIVPHMARSIVGADYRKVLPLAAVMGATLLVLADFAGQWVLYPTETPVGIVTAVLGTPFFIYLLRRRKGRIV